MSPESVFIRRYVRILRTWGRVSVRVGRRRHRCSGGRHTPPLRAPPRTPVRGSPSPVADGSSGFPPVSPSISATDAAQRTIALGVSSRVRIAFALRSNLQEPSCRAKTVRPPQVEAAMSSARAPTPCRATVRTPTCGLPRTRQTWNWPNPCAPDVPCVRAASRQRSPAESRGECGVAKSSTRVRSSLANAPVDVPHEVRSASREKTWCAPDRAVVFGAAVAGRTPGSCTP